MLEIRPANLAQVTSYRGRMVEIADDVTGVAQQLKAIDPSLVLMFADEAKTPYWTVFHREDQPDGSIEERLVLTSLDLGAHIVERVRQIDSDRYDYSAELEATDAAAKRAEEHRYSEQVGEIGERLHHALRQDLAKPTYIRD